MMAYKQMFVLLLSAWLVAGQRPSFAGTKPIGFPEVVTPADPLGNRFGDGQTERLPIEAKGDRALVERLSKLPIDQQPFWFINWKAKEESLKNPQTYPQRESSFAENVGQNIQSTAGANSAGLTSKFGTNEGASANSFASNRQPQQGYRQQSRRSY